MRCDRLSGMTDQSDHYGILNEQTGTIHERKGETKRLQATCGALRHVRSRQLYSIPIEEAIMQEEVTRCGRCFDDGGGY